MFSGLSIALSDVVGVIGSLLVLAAYYSVSNGHMNAKGTLYQWLNLSGALFLLVSLYFRPNPGSILIEFVWSIIAVSALVRIYRNRT